MSTKSEHFFHERDISQDPKGSIRNFQHYRPSFTKLGKMCYVHGVLDAAMKYFGLALQFAQCVDDYNHAEHVAECYRNLALVHSRLGDLERGKEYHERALSSYLKMFDPEHLDVARCYNNLAEVHHKLSDLEQAKEYCDRALATRLRKLDHLDVATSYSNLGLVHDGLGNLEKAKEYHDRTLAVRLKILGPDHLDVEICYSYLGLLHRALDNQKQAKEYCDRACHLSENALS